jgi:hypothetical protein
VFLIVGALAIGSGVRLLRSSPVASEPQAPSQGAAAGVCAAARQRVLGMSSVITRLDRIEVKRMTVQDLDAARDAQAPGVTRPASSLPGNTVLCVVAVGGEIRQTMGLIDTGPFSWSLFVSTVAADDPIISTSAGGNGTWPPYFDALPNRRPNPLPGTVVEAIGPDTLRVRLESGVLSAEFGNPVLVQANKYTEIVPTAPTVAATGVKPGDRVEVFFEREGRDISSGAYPLSIFRLTQSARATVDCGTVRATNGYPPYDQAVLDCVWSAYTRGDAARLSLINVTQEGDPVPTTLLAVPGGRSEVTRDLTADRFTNPADRVVSTYSCTTLTRRPWATDPARYVFDLSNCTGRSATVSFP